MPAGRICQAPARSREIDLGPREASGGERRASAHQRAPRDAALYPAGPAGWSGSVRGDLKPIAPGASSSLQDGAREDGSSEGSRPSWSWSPTAVRAPCRRSPVSPQGQQVLSGSPLTPVLCEDSTSAGLPRWQRPHITAHLLSTARAAGGLGKHSLAISAAMSMFRSLNRLGQRPGGNASASLGGWFCL